MHIDEPSDSLLLALVPFETHFHIDFVGDAGRLGAFIARRGFIRCLVCGDRFEAAAVRCTVVALEDAGDVSFANCHRQRTSRPDLSCPIKGGLRRHVRHEARTRIERVAGPSDLEFNLKGFI